MDLSQLDIPVTSLPRANGGHRDRAWKSRRSRSCLLDRAAIGQAAPFISRQMHLSPAEMGLIFSAFGFTYAAFEMLLRTQLGRRGRGMCAGWGTIGLPLLASFRAVKPVFVFIRTLRP